MKAPHLLVIIMTLPGILAKASDICSKNTDFVCHVDKSSNFIFCIDTADKKIDIAVNGASHPLLGNESTAPAKFEGSESSELIIKGNDFYYGDTTVEYNLLLKPDLEKPGYLKGQLTTASKNNPSDRPVELFCHSYPNTN